MTADKTQVSYLDFATGAPINQKISATLTMWNSISYAYADPGGRHEAADPVEQEEDWCIHSTVGMPFSHLL